MAERRNVFRRLSAWLWRRKLASPEARLRQRQLELSRLMSRRLRCFSATQPGKSSAPRSTGSWAPGRASSRIFSVQRVAHLVNRLSLGLDLGTRLVWRPYHRAKHRAIAWLLCQLSPVLLSEQHLPSLSKPMPRRAVGLPAKPGKPERMIKRWVALSLRLLCRRLLES